MGASVWFFLLLGMEAIRTYKMNPYFTIATYNIPTWTTPLFLMMVISALVPSSSLLGHLCGLAVGYICTFRHSDFLLSNMKVRVNIRRLLTCETGGLGYMKFLSPPEKALRFIESKLNLLQRLPRYVSVDQKTYGRFGVLPSATGTSGPPGVALGAVGSTQRLGP